MWVTGAAMSAWVALICIGHLWGTWLIERGAGIKLLAPPLSGHFDLRITWRLLPAAAVAGLTVWLGPRIATRLAWWLLMFGSATLAGAWALALAFVDGADTVTFPLTRSTEYLSLVPDVDSLTEFIANFTQQLPGYPIHVQGHPPGMVLLLYMLASVGFGGPGWAAAVMIAGGSLCVPAALLVLRDVAGSDRARAAAPFLATLPAAIWIATSADALFVGVSAWAIALFVLATGRSDRRGDILALASGLSFGCALLLTYGSAALLPLVGAVSLWRRRWRPLLLAGLVTAAVLAGAAVLGFWWHRGLAATEVLYRAGVSGSRPYDFFVVNNLAAFALVLGPASVAGLVRVPGSRLSWLVGGALLAVASADLSGLSKGEVERIWLPFAPWVAVATGLLRSPARTWLALQTGAALLVAVSVRTPW
jgi:methylthioxylose transferase